MGKQLNEISALHLVKTYCLPILLFGSEAWSLSDTNLHNVNTIWNNCCRRIFSCCLRESTRPLQFFCKSLPVYLMLDQRKLMLWLKIRSSDKIILSTMSEFVAVSSKYAIDVCNNLNVSLSRVFGLHFMTQLSFRLLTCTCYSVCFMLLCIINIKA